jgi:hypothetical protein
LPPGFLRKEHHPDQSEQDQEYNRPERSADQRSDQSVKGQLQKAEKKAAYEGAYDSYHQIDDQTGSSSSYNLFGQKPGDESYYQEPNQGFNLHIYSHVFLLRQLVERRPPSGNSPTLIHVVSRGALF